jgi:hypothetical protein
MWKSMHIGTFLSQLKMPSSIFLLFADFQIIPMDLSKSRKSFGNILLTIALSLYNLSHKETPVPISPEYIEELKRLAKRTTWEDKMDQNENKTIEDLAGGNVDDAYDGGYRSGEADLARQVLKNMGIDF